MNTNDIQRDMHRMTARVIVRGHSLISNYDLEAQIASALDYIRDDERKFWVQALTETIAVCEKMGQTESAKAIRVVLEAVAEA